VRKAIPFLISVLALVSTSLAAQEQKGVPPPARTSGNPAGHSLTIQEAEAIALRNNPQISVGKLQALQAQQFVREVRSGLLPQASLIVTGVGADEGGRFSAGGFLTNGRMFSRLAGGVAVNQLITDFGRTSNLVSGSQFQAKAAGENAIATKQQIILAVDQAFYNSLETRALDAVASDTVKTRQLALDQVQALTNAKLKSDLDLSFAKVELARAQLLQFDTQNNYDAALSVLSAILGYPDRQDFILVESSATITPPAPDAGPLIQGALDLRPEIRGLRDEVTASEKFSRSEHELWRPTVNALGVVGQAPLRNDNITSWYGAAGVNINVPVFNGFLFNARARTADLAAEVKQKQLQDLQDNIARDVRNGWLDTAKAYQRLAVTKQLREEAALSLELAQERYKLGLGNIVEYSQAELQKTEADIENTDATYQYGLSQILLAYEMGVSR
jgi:outer membrane protein